MKKKIIPFFFVILVFLSACEASLDNAFMDQINKDIDKAGLKNASVTTREEKGETYYTIYCDNFDSFSDLKKVEIGRELNSTRINGVYFLLEEIVCGDNHYSFFFSSSHDTIKINGEEVFTNDKQRTSTNLGTNNHSSNIGIHTDAEAFTVAEYVVKENLKAPSTAQFCKITEATITYLGNKKYEIKGWVDAQNSFGAMIRQNFTVTYTAVKKGSDIGCTNATCKFSD